MIAPVTESAALVVDPQLAAAVEVARQVLAEDVPNDAIGDHLEVVAEGELIATHLFACLNPGYVGWRWAVNVTRVPDSDVVTVNETVLLPGNGSLLSPQWLPWDERVEAGDLGVGDVLPTAPDDVRLVPGYTGVDQDDTEDDDLAPVMWELASEGYACCRPTAVTKLRLAGPTATTGLTPHCKGSFGAMLNVRLLESS